MTTSIELLTDGFGRVRELVERVVAGLDLDRLTTRIDDEANTIAWLVWHLSRVEDGSIAGAASDDELWTSDGWSARFALPFDDRASGYGQSSEDVAAVRVEADLLLDYYDAVHERTIAYLAGLDDTALDRVVDTRWNPPVTLAVRLVSILSDELQHAGQAAYARGVIERRK
jgi:uncharacterized damage-inducible protein DinB